MNLTCNFELLNFEIIRNLAQQNNKYWLLWLIFVRWHVPALAIFLFSLEKKTMKADSVIIRKCISTSCNNCNL